VSPKRFAVGDDEVEALAPVDLTIPQGRIHMPDWSVGAAGKSTLLRIICRF